MGACGGKPAISDADLAQSRAVEAMLNKERQIEYKLLLLGPGESGKSTFFKQMTVGYGRGFDEKDISGFVSNIRECVTSNLTKLAESMEKLEAEPLGPEGAAALEMINAQSEKGGAPGPDYAASAKAYWKDPSVVKHWETRRHAIQVPEALSFFVPNRVDDICSKDYKPTEEDIMRVRVRTSGIIECHFEVAGTRFSLVDVGGQRSERRKWIKCFEDVQTVVFLCAVSEYDQTIFEDEKTNRIHEAMEVFAGLLKEKTFDNTPFVVFFNKMDLFKEKIPRVPLTTCFPEYTGPQQTGPAIEYIREQFFNKFTSLTKTKRKIYMHETQATDRTNCLKVFDVVRATVIEQAFASFDIE